MFRSSAPVPGRSRCGAPRLHAVLPTLLLALLVACASAPPTARLSPGQTEAEMLAIMGQPTSRYALDGSAQRVEYAKGPYGRVTWMVDLDATGRVTKYEQVLTPQNFSRVRDGMSTEDLLRLLGRPSDKARERGDRETWSWRFENHDCQWARVTIGQGRVIGKLLMMSDPQCDPLT